MLRTASSQLFVLGRYSSRGIASSSARLAKIRKADGSTVRPPSASDPPTQDCPRLTPPPPPKQKPKKAPLPSSAAATSTPTPDPVPSSQQAESPTSASSSSAIPTPPVSKPSGPETQPVAETPDADNIDLSDLPSLNIETVSERARVEEGKDEAAGEGSSGGRERTGAGRKKYVSSIERQRRLWLRWSVVGAMVGGAGYIFYQSRSPVSRTSWKMRNVATDSRGLREVMRRVVRLRIAWQTSSMSTPQCSPLVLS